MKQTFCSLIRPGRARLSRARRGLVWQGRAWPDTVHIAAWILFSMLTTAAWAAGPHGDIGSNRSVTGEAINLAADSDYGALAGQIAQAWMDQHPAESMDWNWEEAVLALGLQAVHQATNSDEVLWYIKRWIDYHLARGVHINRSDAVVPATSALYLYEVYGSPAYLDVVDQCHHYLDDVVPRLEDGAIVHTIMTPHQIWVDSLFMFGTFYTMDGAITGNGASFDALAEQYQLFRTHLVSDRADLYWHMYDELADQHVSSTPTFWGRGNGWALASLAMLLTEMPPNHPDRPALEAAFVEHAAAVEHWQDASGLWWTVVNRPGDTYLETSASALFTFALLRGVRLGILGEEALQTAAKGLNGLMSVIAYDESGYPQVTGISKATNPGPYWLYANIPQGTDEPYGIGAVLMAFEEAVR